MSINLIHTDDGKVLEVHVSGKLVGDDYGRFVPMFERMLQKHRKVCVLFEMNEFHG